VSLLQFSLCQIHYCAISAENFLRAGQHTPQNSHNYTQSQAVVH